MTAGKQEILCDLGDGLILRRATREDGDALADFNAHIHSDDGPDKPDERLAAWTLDLVEGPHPTFDISDFTVVEDINSGQIVSTMNLIPQTWCYAGIPIPVGRPELVGTSPEYRNRGLVRAQFEIIHEWSKQRGHLLQGITGIPYYYRLFGYEMCVNLGGTRAGYKHQVPQLKDGEKEPYLVRPAVESDLGFMAEVGRSAGRRYMLACERDKGLWRYELLGKREKNVTRRELRVIESRNGEPVGYLIHPPNIWGEMLAAVGYEVKDGVSWGAVTPSVARYLYATGKAYGERDGLAEKFDGFGFSLGVQHPVYEVMHGGLPHEHKPYAWFMRVADIPRFIKHIIPALETRLERSLYVGHSGELKLTFYRQGIKMIFENGKITLVEAWKPTPQGHSGDAAFPDLTFLQLLLGYRSLDELHSSLVDCWWSGDLAFGLINALFPKQQSNIWYIS